MDNDCEEDNDEEKNNEYLVKVKGQRSSILTWVLRVLVDLRGKLVDVARVVLVLPHWLRRPAPLATTALRGGEG